VIVSSSVPKNAIDIVTVWEFVFFLKFVQKAWSQRGVDFRDWRLKHFRFKGQLTNGE